MAHDQSSPDIARIPARRRAFALFIDPSSFTGAFNGYPQEKIPDLDGITAKLRQLGDIYDGGIIPQFDKSLRFLCQTVGSALDGIICTASPGMDLVSTYRTARSVLAECNLATRFLGLIPDSAEEKPGLIKEIDAGGRIRKDDFISMPDPKFYDTLEAMVFSMLKKPRPLLIVDDVPLHSSPLSPLQSYPIIVVHSFDEAMERYLSQTPLAVLVNLDMRKRNSFLPEAAELLSVVSINNQRALSSHDGDCNSPVLLYGVLDQVWKKGNLLLASCAGPAIYTDIRHPNFVKQIMLQLEKINLDPLYNPLSDFTKIKIALLAERGLTLPNLHDDPEKYLTAEDIPLRLIALGEAIVKEAGLMAPSYRLRLEHLMESVASMNSAESALAGGVLQVALAGLPKPEKKKLEAYLQFKLQEYWPTQLVVEKLYDHLLRDFEGAVESGDLDRPSSHGLPTFIVRRPEANIYFKVGPKEVIQRYKRNTTYFLRFNRLCREILSELGARLDKEEPLIAPVSGFRSAEPFKSQHFPDNSWRLIEMEKPQSRPLLSLFAELENQPGQIRRLFEEGYRKSAILTANGPLAGQFLIDEGPLENFFNRRLDQVIIPSLKWLLTSYSLPMQESFFDSIRSSHKFLNTKLLEACQALPGLIPNVFSPDIHAGNMGDDPLEGIYEFGFGTRIRAFPILYPMADMWQLADFGKGGDSDEEYVHYQNQQALQFLHYYNHTLLQFYMPINQRYHADVKNFAIAEIERDIVALQQYLPLTAAEERHAAHHPRIFESAEGALEAFSYLRNFPDFRELQNEIASFQGHRMTTHPGMVNYLSQRIQESSDNPRLADYLETLKDFLEGVAVQKQQMDGFMESFFDEQVSRNLLPHFHNAVRLKAFTSFCTYLTYLRAFETEHSHHISSQSVRRILQQGIGQLQIAKRSASWYAQKMKDIHVDSAYQSLATDFSKLQENLYQIASRHS